VLEVYLHALGMLGDPATQAEAAAAAERMIAAE
jgi:hypothetical protein